MWLQFGGFVTKVAFSFKSQGTEKIFFPKGQVRLYKEYPNQIVNAFTTYTIKLLMYSCVFSTFQISTFVYTKEVR